MRKNTKNSVISACMTAFFFNIFIENAVRGYSSTHDTTRTSSVSGVMR